MAFGSFARLICLMSIMVLLAGPAFADSHARNTIRKRHNAPTLVLETRQTTLLSEVGAIATGVVDCAYDVIEGEATEGAVV